MKKYLIFVEGVADVIFIRDYILYFQKGFSFEMIKRNSNSKKKTDCRITCENIEIIIIKGKGYTDVKNAKVLFTRYLKDKYKILVIQDADDPLKNDGGKVQRMEYLDRVKKSIDIDFNIFLFPNNKDNGDLEKLLIRIVNTEKFKKSYDCYETYANCSSKVSSDYSHELLIDKAVIFNYFRTYNGMFNSKEENRVFSSIFWDFENEYLKPLSDFLKDIIN